MRVTTLSSLAVVSLLASAAPAQNMTTAFRGFRLEANGGGDFFYSQGKHDRNFGYGASVGFDGMIGDRIVIGPEATIWRANRNAANCAGFGTGALCIRSYNEYGAAIRAGYLVTPEILVFGKGGYVNNKQRGVFAGQPALFYVNGQIVRLDTSGTKSIGIGGYQVGGGVEYSATDRWYANIQYVYSNYDNHTSRVRGMVGLGARFK